VNELSGGVNLALAHGFANASMWRLTRRSTGRAGMRLCSCRHRRGPPA